MGVEMRVSRTNIAELAIWCENASHQGMFHSDRHFPKSFLSGNPSLRDMVKDKGDFDRRLDDINKRQVERRRNEKETETSKITSNTTSRGNEMSSMLGAFKRAPSPSRAEPPFNSRAFRQAFVDTSTRGSSMPRLSPQRQTSGIE